MKLRNRESKADQTFHPARCQYFIQESFLTLSHTGIHDPILGLYKAYKALSFLMKKVYTLQEVEVTMGTEGSVNLAHFSHLGAKGNDYFFQICITD